MGASAASACGLVLQDFFGCIACEPSALAAFISWVQEQLWERVLQQNRSTARFEVLCIADAVRLFGVGTTSPMIQDARELFRTLFCTATLPANQSSLMPLTVPAQEDARVHMQ